MGFARATAARNFGLSLLALGVLLLIGGIFRHLQFAAELRRRRRLMTDDQLIHGESAYPVSMTLITAVLLLVLGLVAAASIVFDINLLG